MWNDFNAIRPSKSGTYFVKLKNGDVGVADFTKYTYGDDYSWDVNDDIIEFNMLDDSGFYTELEADVAYWMEVPTT